jgi:hypothetical protein
MGTGLALMAAGAPYAASSPPVAHDNTLANNDGGLAELRRHGGPPQSLDVSIRQKLAARVLCPCRRRRGCRAR